MSQPKIDFVITWVDGADPKWLAEKLRTLQEVDSLEAQKTDSSDLRFRNDFDFLKFWFRGVEKFAPWVNQIFFVTYGHTPNLKLFAMRILFRMNFSLLLIPIPLKITST